MLTKNKTRLEEWEDVHKVVPWGSVPDRNFQKFIEWDGDCALRDTRTTFLDLGCGAGAQAIWLAEQGFKVYAVDGSAAAIKRLTERAARVTMRGELWPVVQDLTTIGANDWQDSTFNCIFDMCCLQHMTEDEAVELVRKARRWLKPRGWFWSKQAIAPFDASLNRVSFIRTATTESIRRMFMDSYAGGYVDVKLDMLREVVRGDKDLWSVIVLARAGV
jgi:2-polyprenyl-3-methyl-5-hydroxy-6-metoxy-1,4-benzoquinol methylase